MTPEPRERWKKLAAEAAETECYFEAEWKRQQQTWPGRLDPFAQCIKAALEGTRRLRKLAEARRDDMR